MPQLTLEGMVFSGEGKGKCFMALPWVKQQIRQKLGFEVYSGTLNIRLSAESTKKRHQLNPKLGITVEPKEGFYSGVLFKAEIEKEKCAVVLPLTPNYPPEILEIISPDYLRGKLKLRDGSELTIAVTF